MPLDRAGDAAARRHGARRRSFLSRSAGLALAVYGGTSAGSHAFDDGIAARRRAPPNAVLISIFLDGGADALSMLFPDGDPRYRVLRPKLALPASPGSAFSEDARLRWHPSARLARDAPRRGQGHVLPGDRLHDPDQSHFTSRHYWEVGATDPQLRTGWLGRYLDRVGAPDNPLQGLSLVTRCSRRSRPRKVPVASVDGPDGYDSGAQRRLGQPSRSRCCRRSARSARARESKDPALRAAGRIALAGRRLRDAARAVRPENGRPASAARSPIPTSNDQFPRGSPDSPRCSARGCRSTASRSTAPGIYDTHATQADELSDALKLTADTLLAFQRDLEARGLADRVLVHVWSEFGRRARGERLARHRPRRGRAAGFLIGSRVSGEMVGEFPGLTTGLDENGNLRATSDFRGVYARCSSSGSGRTRRRSSRTPRPSSGRR